MIRTVWLGFIFLIILAGAGSFRLAFGHFDAANASAIVPSDDNRTVGSAVANDTLTKADQLPPAYAAPVPDAAELAKAAHNAVELLHRPLPAVVVVMPDVVEPAPDVVEQQAQAPVPPVVQSATTVVRKTKVQKPKRKQPKPDAVASKPPPVAELKNCQLEEFDALRYAFSLQTGCHG